MRAIILCGGEGTRWKGRSPKHFAEIDGERLIDRTVRLLSERGASDVWTVAPDDERYQVAGSQRVAPESIGYDIDKVLCCRSLWTDDTLLLCGDVWFSEPAMDSIAGQRPGDFAFYGRRYRSTITGAKWGEIFAFRFCAGVPVAKRAAALRREVESGRLERAKLWELYQTLIGEPPKPFQEQIFDSRWIDIDDWTDDFDTVEEYEEWIRRRLSR